MTPPPAFAEIPAVLVAHLQGYEIERVYGGCAGSEVYRLWATGRETLFLKSRSHAADSDGPHELQEEYARLEWLGRVAGGEFRERLGAPEVRFFETHDERDYLLLTAVPGVDASDSRHASDPDRVIPALAEGLRRLHTLPVPDCPFAPTLDEMLARAGQRVEAGLVDESEFDDCRQGRTALDLWEELCATRPTVEERVFTHGDYCLPNVLLAEDGQFSGLIDWSRCGIADRHMDLALARRSLEYNWGAEREARLWQEYGLAPPDPARLEFYQLLDEFF